VAQSSHSPPATAAALRERLGQAIARASRSLVALDLHTSGEPTRILFDLLDREPWPNAAKARDEVRDRHDWLRRAATFEPRGHRGMFAAAVVPVALHETPWGAVFLSPDGYPDMCGHATIGVATALVEVGLVGASGPVASFVLDTPSGAIPVSVEIGDGRPRRVTFRNRPSFLHERVTVDGPDGRSLEVAVAWGGQWYAFVDVEPFGLVVELTQADRLVAAANAVRSQLAERVSRPDPRDGSALQGINVVWVGPPRPGAHSRQVPISPAGAFDRSPCGTGTSAKAAVLHADGRLRMGDVFVSEGILGTRFEARIVEEVELDGLRAVVPEVSGEAWLSGLAELWIEATDPLGDGFLPGEPHA
jgi:proline racemase